MSTCSPHLVAFNMVIQNKLGQENPFWLILLMPFEADVYRASETRIQDIAS